MIKCIFNDLKFKLVLFFALILIFQFNSCVPDSDESNNQTELFISFDNGPLAGKDFSFVTPSTVEVLNFFPNANQSRAFVDELESVDGRALKSTSSVNFAWQGAAVNGVFKTFNFSNPTSPNTGDIELQFNDGEFINAAIPSNINLTIFNYQVVDEIVSGSINFSTRVYYEINGKSQSFDSNCTISFGLVRGQDR